MEEKLLKKIEINPKIMVGKPVIKSTFNCRVYS